MNDASSTFLPTHSRRLNLARFDLLSLQLVVLCAQEGSLAEAAKMAHMSKSTASYRLTSVEDSFGHVLFHRDHRGLQLTGAGEVFAAGARSILHEVSQLGYQLSRISAADATFSAPRYGARST